MSEDNQMFLAIWLGTPIAFAIAFIVFRLGLAASRWIESKFWKVVVLMANDKQAVVAILLLTLTGCIHPKLPPCTTNNQAVPLSHCRYFDLPGNQAYLCGVVPEGEQKYERCQGHAEGATEHD